MTAAVGAVVGATAECRPAAAVAPLSPPLPRNAAALLAECVSPRPSGGTSDRLAPEPAPSLPPFPLPVPLLLLALLYVV